MPNDDQCVPQINGLYQTKAPKKNDEAPTVPDTNNNLMGDDDVDFTCDIDNIRQSMVPYS